MTWSRHYREAHAADDHPRRQELREANRPHPVDRSTGKGSGRDAFLVARQEIRDARA